MRLESARSLKVELLQGLVHPMVAAARAWPAATSRAAPATARAELAVAAQDRGLVQGTPRSIALGVVPGARGAYRLAVRVQRQARVGGAMVDRLVRRARGEAEVRFVGRLGKRVARKRAVRIAWFRTDVRPLLIGASVGHVDVTAGTIGGFVRRGRAAQVYLLSNNHVLANENDAASGDPVLQPGYLDRGRDPRSRIGTLARFIRLRPNSANQVDCALVALDEGIEFDPTRLRDIRGGGRDARLAGIGPEFVDQGTTVFKVGRTTGPTRGQVTAFDVDNLVISYDLGNLRFDNQIEIEGAGRGPFSDGGDSGSLIVNADFQAVALLFAGGESGGRNGLGLTYADPITTVFRRLGATLVG